MTKDDKKENGISQTPPQSASLQGTNPHGNTFSQTASQTPPLSQEILAAINATVQETMKSAVVEIVKALKPQTSQALPVNPPVSQKPHFVPPASTDYKPKLVGIQVEEGQDLRHVHPSVINDWFSKVESKWKDKYNKKGYDSKPAELT